MARFGSKLEKFHRFSTQRPCLTGEVFLVVYSTHHLIFHCAKKKKKPETVLVI